MNDNLCSDWPPAGYPTYKTRCAPCPLRRWTSEELAWLRGNDLGSVAEHIEALYAERAVLERTLRTRGIDGCVLGGVDPSTGTFECLKMERGECNCAEFTQFADSLATDARVGAPYTVNNSSTIPCHRGGWNCLWPACSSDCDGRPGGNP